MEVGCVGSGRVGGGSWGLLACWLRASWEVSKRLDPPLNTTLRTHRTRCTFSFCMQTPSALPTGTPSVGPSAFPSLTPSLAPTSAAEYNSMQPTLSPTLQPSGSPSLGPTAAPSLAPSLLPTTLPPSTVRSPLMLRMRARCHSMHVRAQSACVLVGARICPEAEWRWDV